MGYQGLLGTKLGTTPIRPTMMNPVDDDDYQTSPQGYLARCRDRLREGTKAGIFYAALELRGCIEARHAEYFEHHEPLSGTKFQPWRLGESQKVVAKITEGALLH